MHVALVLFMKKLAQIKITMPKQVLVYLEFRGCHINDSMFKCYICTCSYCIIMLLIHIKNYLTFFSLRKLERNCEQLAYVYSR
jgi:hypothetical protein